MNINKKGNEEKLHDLSKRVVDCLSDGYDDEENREVGEDDLYSELSQLESDCVISVVLSALCSTIEELLVKN